MKWMSELWNVTNEIFVLYEVDFKTSISNAV